MQHADGLLRRFDDRDVFGAGGKREGESACATANVEDGCVRIDQSEEGVDGRVIRAMNVSRTVGVGETTVTTVNVTVAMSVSASMFIMLMALVMVVMRVVVFRGCGRFVSSPPHGRGR